MLRDRKLLGEGAASLGRSGTNPSRLEKLARGVDSSKRPDGSNSATSIFDFNIVTLRSELGILARGAVDLRGRGER